MKGKERGGGGGVVGGKKNTMTLKCCHFLFNIISLLYYTSLLLLLLLLFLQCLLLGLLSLQSRRIILYVDVYVYVFFFFQFYVMYYSILSCPFHRTHCYYSPTTTLQMFAGKSNLHQSIFYNRYYNRCYNRLLILWNSFVRTSKSFFHRSMMINPALENLLAR